MASDAEVETERTTYHGISREKEEETRRGEKRREIGTEREREKGVGERKREITIVSLCCKRALQEAARLRLPPHQHHSMSHNNTTLFTTLFTLVFPPISRKREAWVKARCPQ